MTAISSHSIHPSEICCHELFERQAERLSQHIAVIDRQQQLTYAELNTRANQLAHYLRSLGAGPETLIPICVDRSVAMAVGILGILKAGAAYVPIDPAYPAERIEFMLNDTAAPLVVTQANLIAKLPSANARFVTLDSDWPEIAKWGHDNPNVTLAADNLAYVIYTSGSTGKPKGTMLTQRNLSHYVLALQAELNLTCDDRYLHLASIAFSSARRHLLLPLTHGATVVIADEDERLDPLPLFRMLQKRNVTVFDAVPSFQRHCTNALLELAPEERGELLNNKIRLILSASEPLLSDLPRSWMQEFEHRAQHVHMMGQTETSGIVALHHLTKADVTGQVKVVPVGRPIANTQIYLLDENQQPVPAGEVGEMYICGAGIGRGYWQRPELTAEKFTEFAVHSSQFTALSTTNRELRTANSLRLCRTGDFARLLPDGTLECVGRQDFQVKIRGQRVELGEIEALLTSHHEVRECAVMAREDVPGQKRLVAYVVTRNQQISTITELRELAQRELPDYMQPAAFVTLAALPLTPNGKTDRKALPAPTETAFENEDNYIAPRNQTEETIAKIWATVLGLRRVGLHEHFFALGGHSLLASQVIARVRVACEVDIPLRTIFEAPTVAELAAKVEQYLNRKSQTIAPALLPISKQGKLPLSFSQQRLWFLDQLEPHSATYNLSKLVRLKGRLEVAALRKALQAIVDRHETLRTSFTATEGEASQVIAASVPFDLPITDVSDSLPERRITEAQRIAHALAEEPFDLTCSPLLRVRLIKLSAEEHLLAIVFHHIVSDGWSVGIFLQELGTLYQAFCASHATVLPLLPVQYADYAAWQRQHLVGEVLDEQLQFWKQHLAGAPALLELPTDKPRPAVQRYQGSQVSLLLSAEIRDALQSLSQREGVTLFMTLLAAFQVLLARYAQQEQIVVGTPIAGRTRVETENLIGFFVNTLALRGDLSGNPGFRALLQRTREAALGAYAHQELPFEKLVEELRPERSLSYTPLFQVMFALQNAPRGEQAWGGVEVEMLKVASQTAKFDLSLDVYERPEGLEVFLEFDTDLFETSTAQRWLQHWQVLLEEIVKNSTRRIHELPLLTPQEQQQILVEWNQQTVAVPSLCLHQLFEQQAERAPDDTAVVWQEEHITYGELNARANQLAHYLQKAGIEPEVIVGLCVERSIEMIVGVLGILKAGGAYLPLDPNYPSERLAHMLQDAQVKILLTQKELANSLPAHNAQVICLDTDWQEITQESTAAPPAALTPDNLAYVIYTSGSTGKSKGVLVTHHSVVNAYVAWADAYQLSSLRSHLQMANFSFDVFTGDWTRALCSGAKLVLCPSELLLESEQLYQLLRREDIEAAEFVPAVLRPLLEYLEQTDQRLDFMTLVVAGSDVWQMKEYRKLKQFCGTQTRVISSYGVTEATIDSTYFEATEENLNAEGIVPIGRPFANTQIYLLDSSHNPVPIGIPGELYIGGAGVARGYLNRPELTAEKFIADCGFGIADCRKNPQSAIRNPKLYRTGDLGRYRSDGTIELLGRADQQVKLRGYRIELGEIEATLAAHPAVSECAVIVQEATPGDKRLSAYIILKDSSVTARELRLYVKTRLPEYMVPATFVRLDAWPLTPNGKVDRRALSVLAGEETHATTENNYVAPRTPTEEVVAQIWADLLKLNRIGIHDNFFELGGHSLLATQIISRIRNAFRIEIPLRALFETPTVAGLTMEIVSTMQAGRGVEACPIKSDQGQSLQSYAQQRLWFLDQFDPGSHVYNLPVLLRLEGELDARWLEQSINEIIKRHEVLRTTFAMQEGEPIQNILPELSLPLATMEVADLAELEMQVKALVTQPFDLQDGPLLRAQLMRLSTTVHYLLIVFHHIVSDGWSVDIFLQELGALYQAALTRQVSPLPSLPIQYADFAAWQHQYLTGDVLSEQLQFWKQYLVGAPPLLTLPTDKPRPAVQRSRGAQVSCLLSEELRTSLQALSQREGVTLFMTMLAAFQILLARYAQQEQIVVGTPIAGRTREESEHLIGCFVNTLALRGDLSGNPTFRTLLQRTRASALGAYAHQELPFEKLVEELRPERSLSYTPLFQVMFAWQPAPRGEHNWSGVEVAVMKVPSETAKFDLSLDVYEKPEGLEVFLEFDTDLFVAATAKRMLDHYQHLLSEIVRDAEQRIHALPLSGEETLRVSVLGNDKTTGNSLAELNATRFELAECYVAPRTPTEEVIANIWANLLHRKQVGIYDNFFDLGGHSLLATRVIARIRDRFELKLPLRALFETPTVAALAAVVEEMIFSQEPESELDGLLNELEGMSEEEIQYLLAQSSPQQGERAWL